MNGLPTDTILYLMDMMIIPAKEYLNIFLLNHHWREATEENPEFWLRQLAGLFYMVCKENDEGKKDDSEQFTIHGLNYFQFYCKFFCNRKGMHYLMKHQNVLKKNFKKVADFLSIIEMRQNLEDIHDFSLIRKTFLNLNSTIKGYIKTKFEKEKLGMLTSSNVFDYYSQYLFFEKDEYEMNREIIIHSKSDKSFDIYWNYLLNYTKSIKSSPKSLELIQLFLEHSIYSKQYFIRKIATLITMLSHLLSDDIKFKNQVVELILKLISRYFTTSIGSNLTAKYEKGSELISYLLFDHFETVELKKEYIEKVRKLISPTIVSNNFKDKQSKRDEFKIIYNMNELIDLVQGEYFHVLVLYIVNHFYCDKVMIETMLSRCVKYETILYFYSQTRIVYSKVCNLRTFINNTECFDLDTVINHILVHYEMDGKDKRQLIKDFNLTEPFSEVLLIGRNSNNLEPMKMRLDYLIDLFSKFYTNDQIKTFLKYAYFNSGMIGHSHSVDVTKLFMNEYQLSPQDCSMVVTSINPSIFKWTEQIQRSIQNFPSKWNPHKKIIEFKLHPIVNHILTKRDRDHVGNLNGFLQICGNDRVIVPLLLDHDGVSNNVKQHIYVDYLDQKKKEGKYRFVIKYITLEDLINNTKMDLFY